MPFEPQGLPVSGGLFVACAAYAAISFFVTGPIIGERVIAKSGWMESCQLALDAEISSQKPAAPIVPRVDCQSMVGWLGPVFETICTNHGNPELKLPQQRMVEAQEQALYEAKERQLVNKAKQSPSRCACAATLALENRIGWALYAGSARLVTPPKIKHLNTTLIGALHTPHCALKGGGTS